MKDFSKTGVCCICGGKYEMYGNNPEPYVGHEVGSGRCCHRCNDVIVIPYRLALFQMQGEPKQILKDFKQRVNDLRAMDDFLKVA